MAAMLALCVLCSVGCAIAQAQTPPPTGQWVAAYTADFLKSNVLEDEWLPRQCEPKIIDGKFILPPAQRRGRVLSYYDAQRFGQSVRVDMIVSLTAANPAALALGVCISGDGFDSPTGYLFQFGAKGCLLKKETSSWDVDEQMGIHDGSHLNRPVKDVANSEIHAEAGKLHHLVAERDGGKLSLWVDETLAFSYLDPAPITGPDRSFVGLSAQNCTLTVEKFAVYTRGDTPSASDLPAPSKEPTITVAGVLICSRVAASREDEGLHTPLLYAYDGTPQIRSDLDRIMKTYYSDGVGLDVDRARNVQSEFDKNLRYSLTDCHLSRKHHSESHYRSQMMAITGVAYEKDGARWLYPISIKLADASPAQMRQDPSRRAFEYPKAMAAPDKPFAMPGKTPLMLNISDNLSLKCILLPSGSFMAGSPFYQSYRWQDEYAHEVVLTKPFYLAEHPITQEMFEAVMGKNPSKTKGPKLPVEKMSYPDMEEFCRRVSQKTGRMVRVPTDAEWEYAARVGTSSPCITEKYLGQFSFTLDPHYQKPLPVKSHNPNAWGIYDMISGAWCVVSDYAANNVRTTQVDQKGPAKTDRMVRDYGRGPIHKAKGGEYYDDWRPSMHGAADEDGGGAEGNTIFTVVVEATLEEIAVK